MSLKMLNIFLINSDMLADLNKTSNCRLLMKCMKTEVFYCKSDMHMRPMQFSILCTPIDSSDKNPNDVFYYVVVLA